MRFVVKSLKGFKGCVNVIWGTNILFEKLTPEMGGCIWKTLFAHNAPGAGDFMQSLCFMFTSVLTIFPEVQYRQNSRAKTSEKNPKSIIT